MAQEQTGALATDWIESTIQSLGVQLDPSGEINIIDFVINTPSNNRELLQARLTGIQYQLAANFMASLIFASNVFLVIKLLYARPNSFQNWCCLVPAALGMAHGMVSSFSFAVGYVSCRKMLWFVICALTIATIFNSAIVLQKAYLALRRQYWVPVIGISLILPQFGFIILAIQHSQITLEAYSGCVITYPAYIPWYWFSLTVPINSFFSGIFSYVTYKQYKIYGSDAWRRLAREGIQVMCLVVLCNIICGTCILLKVGGDSSILFFLADWLMTSIVLSNQCARACKRSNSITESKPRPTKFQITQFDFKESMTTRHISFACRNSYTLTH